MNGKQMTGNRYELRAGIFKGRNPSAAIRALIVERDSALAMMMVFGLTASGWDVDAVYTGKEGLDLARKSQFDLIMLGVDLPDTNAFNLCRKFRRRKISCKTPVFLILNKASTKEMVSWGGCDATDCLAKPFTITEMVRKATNCVQTQNVMRN